MVSEKDKRIKDFLTLVGAIIYCCSLSKNSLSPKVYWLGTFLADYLLFLMPCILCLIIFYAVKIPMFYDNSPVGPILLFLSFGFGCIPVGYVISLLFDKEETANSMSYSS